MASMIWVVALLNTTSVPVQCGWLSPVGEQRAQLAPGERIEIEAAPDSIVCAVPPAHVDAVRMELIREAAL